MQHIDGPATAKSKLLRDYEEQKLYPPWLSLRVIRTSHEVQQNLETEVSVEGIDPPVEFSIFARAPGNGASEIKPKIMKCPHCKKDKRHFLGNKHKCWFKVGGSTKHVVNMID